MKGGWLFPEKIALDQQTTPRGVPSICETCSPPFCHSRSRFIKFAFFSLAWLVEVNIAKGTMDRGIEPNNILDCTIHKVCSNFSFILITQSRQLGNSRLLGPVLISAQKTDVQTKTTHCNVDNFNEQSYASSALQSRSEADYNLEAEMLQKD